MKACLQLQPEFCSIENLLHLTSVALCFCHCWCVHYMVLFLKLDLKMFLDLLLLLNVCYWNKQNLYSPYLYDLFLHGISPVLVPGYGQLYFSHFCRPPWSGWYCHTMHTFLHRLGILWAYGWNHNICISGLWAFWHLFVGFSLNSLSPFFTVFILSKSCV